MREQLVTSAAQTYGGVSKCTSITVHETANTSAGADAKAHANLQSSGNVRQASWHIQVDDTEAIRSYPDSAQCWHAGPAAADSIAVEICVNADGDYEAAFTRAAAVVADLRAKHGIPRGKVYDHAHWTGKNCPSVMRATGRWQEFLNLTEGATPVSTMISPVAGRVSSEWAKSRRNPATGRTTTHAGIDIAAAVGTPVVAAFGGRVVSVRTGSYRGDSRLWAGAKSGNHVRILNTDGAVQYYGHLDTVGVKVGQTITQGQVIGTVGETGMVTGPHCHFETWSRDNINSHFNPRILFSRYGVAPGSAPGKVIAPTASKPKPATPAKSSNSKSDNTAIQKALTNMGLNVGFPDGVNGKMQKAAVKAFQKHHGLVEDEYWGPVVQAKFDENKRLQNALNQMKSNTPKLTVDGWIGNPTTRRKNDVLKRNGWTNANLIANLKKVKAW